MPKNYIDQAKVRKDFPKVFERYEAENAKVEAVPGVNVNLLKLKSNEAVVYGDGETFHFKLTYKKS